MTNVYEIEDNCAFLVAKERVVSIDRSYDRGIQHPNDKINRDVYYFVKLKILNFLFYVGYT